MSTRLLWRPLRATLPVKRGCKYIHIRTYSSSPRALPPVIQIQNATFYHHYPKDASLERERNPPIYPDLTFILPSHLSPPGSSKSPQQQQQQQQQQHWAVIGSSDRSSFLNVLRGQYICIPPTARSYPLLATDEIAAKNTRLRLPSHAIRYVGFNGDAKHDAGGMRGPYLSARYESRREETDFSVLQYLKGETELNPLEDSSATSVGAKDGLESVISDLGLEKLVDMPVANLSNGQLRRFRIAKALLERPEVLLLDDPFMGLDPPTVKRLSALLYKLSVKGSPQLVMSLRPQDPLPDWVTHLVVLGPGHTVAFQGERKKVFKDLKESIQGGTEVKGPEHTTLLHDLNVLSNNGSKPISRREIKDGEPIIEMDGVQVTYGEKTVLGGCHQSESPTTTTPTTTKKNGLSWTVRRGQRWGVFGLNGSGKTTLISLITSDHPQAYGLPLKLFGRSRLPEPGRPAISIFDLQARIGHSSPEVHAFFPRRLSIRAAIESAWADTFLSKPRLDEARRLDVDSALRFFEADLKAENELVEAGSGEGSKPGDGNGNGWAGEIQFSALTVSQQRLVLFLRAVIHKPDLVVLDEAFSSMPASLRDKCIQFLEAGESQAGITGQIRHTGLSESQALIVVSHVKEEVPDIVSHWIRLPSGSEDESGGSGLRFGTLGERQTVSDVWSEIWEL